METTLFDILKEQGLFSNDIKSRMKNKQIKINGEIVTENLKINISGIFPTDEFIASLCSNPKWALQMQFIGLENILFSNIETDLKEVLKKNIIIRTSKKQSFVIKTI
jgi:hypothetical protein